MVSGGEGSGDGQLPESQNAPSIGVETITIVMTMPITQGAVLV